MSLVPTVRIPELAPLTVGLDLALIDKIPIYIASENKTKKVSLQELNTFFATGGGGVHPPVVYGGEMIYIVDALADGTDTASITSIAGLDFTLERGGLPMIALLPDNSNIAIAEYEILDAGGFKLLQPGDLLTLNERFKLSLFTLIGGGGGGGGTTVASFLTGKKVVASNLTLDPALDMNKLIQLRGENTSLTLTLPDISDMAANSFIPIEALINQNKACTITTTGGQYIYFNGTGKTSIFIHPGEVVWLYRDTDGLYIINDFAERYKHLAKPFAGYKADLNQLVCKGQLVNRADYPRLWEYVQTLGSSFVSDATWSTANVYRQGNTYTTTAPGGTYETIPNPYRGCFSSGDGSLTFRLPDLMNMALRGLLAESGSDDERYLNKAGMYQPDAFESHQHGVDTTGNQTGVNPGRAIQRSSTNGDGYEQGSGTLDYIEEVGGAETRMENIGVLWLINV